MSKILAFCLTVLPLLLGAADVLTVFDRSNGASQLQQLLGSVWKNKALKLPENLEIEVKNVSGNDLPQLEKNQLIIEEAFAPVQDLDRYTLCNYAIVPVIVAVPANSPVDDLSFEQLKRIYSGVTNNWKLLGAPEKSLRIAGCKSDSAQTRIFRKLVMQQDLWSNAPAGVDNLILPDMLICSAPGAANLLEAIDGLIVFGSLELLRNNSGKYRLVKINGVAPSMENIVSGRYPLSACYRIRCLKTASPVQVQAVAEFLRRATADNGEMLVCEQK